MMTLIVDEQVDTEITSMLGEIERLTAQVENLQTEVRQCSVELEEAANLLRPHLTGMASIFALAAERLRKAAEQIGN